MGGAILRGEGAANCKLKYIGTLWSPVRNGWTDRDAVCFVDFDWPKESWIKWVHSRSTMRRGNFGERVAHCKGYGISVSCAEMAEPIDLPFGLWTRVGRRKHMFNHIRQVAPMCPHGRTHWRHLMNTVEPSICSSDAGAYVKLLWPLVLCDSCWDSNPVFLLSSKFKPLFSGGFLCFGT